MNANDIKRLENSIKEMLESEAGKNVIKNYIDCKYYEAAERLSNKNISFWERTLIALLRPQLLEYCKGAIDEVAQIVMTINNTSYLKYVTDKSKFTYEFLAIRSFDIASYDEKKEALEIYNEAFEFDKRLNRLI